MITTPCILWWGPVGHHGYGRITRGKRHSSERAHVRIYEECYGPIQEGHD